MKTNGIMLIAVMQEAENAILVVMEITRRLYDRKPRHPALQAS